MNPAIILAALTAAGEPAPQTATEPQCFPSAIETALFLGANFDEALVRIEPVSESTARLTFLGPRTWTEVVGKSGEWCVASFGEKP